VAKASESKVRLLSLSSIDEPAGRVRLGINEQSIQELADSISAVDLLQPILVRPVGDRFEIVFGHRRFLACQRLGWQKIQAVVRELTDADVALRRATENIAREDLSPVEEAAIYQDLRDTHGLSIDQIGKRMGKSAGVVKRRLDLLKMPPQLQKAIHEKKISYSVAEELWSLGDISGIDYYLAFAVDHGATTAVVREWVREWKSAQRAKEADPEGGRGVASPMQSRPVYVSCDLCQGPMEIGQETTIRACPGCVETIRKALGVVPG